MDNEKYDILLRVYSSTIQKSVTRRDLYQETEKINLRKKLIDELITVGLLYQQPGSDVLQLTKHGLLELEEETERRKSNRNKSLRYWITTAISLLALAISIIALLSQLGIIPLPRY